MDISTPTCWRGKESREFSHIDFDERREMVTNGSKQIKTKKIILLHINQTVSKSWKSLICTRPWMIPEPPFYLKQISLYWFLIKFLRTKKKQEKGFVFFYFQYGDQELDMFWSNILYIFQLSMSTSPIPECVFMNL